MHVQIAGATDPGLRRGQNEDAVWWQPQGADGEAEGAVLIVADGMGGAAAGEIASQAALAKCVETLSGATEPTSLLKRLKDAIEAANRHVFQLSQGDPRYEGMGTTLSVAAIVNDRLYVGHVGDSRCYVIRGGQPTRITTDHTWVAEEVQSGRLSPQQAAQHPARNVISRSVGVGPAVAVDTYGPLDLRDGDVVLLCSDGLSDVVSDTEIARIASSHPPEEIVERLVGLANRHGGPDNISVVVAQTTGEHASRVIDEEETAEVTLKLSQPGRVRHSRFIALAGVSVLIVVAGVVFGIVALASGGGGGQSPAVFVNPDPTEAPVASPEASPQETSGPSPAPKEPVLTGLTCANGRQPAFTDEVSEEDTGLLDVALRNGLSFENLQDIVECDERLSTTDDTIYPGQEITMPCPVEGPCPPAGALSGR